MDWSSNDKLKNYKFTGDYIRFLDAQGELWGMETNVFKVKTRLSIRRVPKPKKKTIDFVVLEEWIYPKGIVKKREDINPDDFIDCVGNDIGFKTEKEAIGFFVNKVEELKFFAEKDKKNILFDGMRYFWKVDEKGKPIEKMIC